MALALHPQACYLQVVCEIIHCLYQLIQTIGVKISNMSMRRIVAAGLIYVSQGGVRSPRKLLRCMIWVDDVNC